MQKVFTNVKIVNRAAGFDPIYVLEPHEVTLREIADYMLGWDEPDYTTFEHGGPVDHVVTYYPRAQYLDVDGVPVLFASIPRGDA